MFRHIFQFKMALDNRTANNKTQFKIVELFGIYCSQYYRSNSAFSHQRISLREALAGRGSAQERDRSSLPRGAQELAGTGAGGRPELPPAHPPPPRPRSAARRPSQAEAGPAASPAAARSPALRPEPRSAGSGPGGAGGPAEVVGAVSPEGWGWSRCSRPGATSGGGSSGSARISARSCWRDRLASR